MSAIRRFSTLSAAAIVLAGLVFITTRVSADDAKKEAAVVCKAMKFDPATLEIKVRTKVTWTNKDPKNHNVRPGKRDANKNDGPINGDLPANGGTWSYTFDKAGEYDYYCDRHFGMDGKVVVK